MPKSNRTPSTILFDLDGTLLDTAPDLAAALNIVLEKHQRDPLPFARLRPFASAGTRGLLGLGFNIQESDPSYPALRLEFLQAYHENLAVHTTFFPGIIEVLEAIETQGLQWGVVTNKPTNLSQELLVAFHLAKRAACIVGADIVAHRKPAPDSLFLACQLIEARPNECIYIGDAKRDIEAAHCAGMPAAAALYGYIQPDDDPLSWGAEYTINQPIELLTLLKLGQTIGSLR